MPVETDERVRALCTQLADVGARAVRAGLVVGSGGNLSARIEPGGEVCVVTGSGTWLDALTPADFAMVRIADGEPLEERPRPSSELPLHLHVYRARPDVNAIVHLHPQMSVLLTTLGRPISLTTTDHLFYVRQVRTLPFAPPGSAELAEAGARAAAEGCDCLVLERHGCSVIADSVELAAKRAFNLEEAAAATYRALLLGADFPPMPDAAFAWARSSGTA